MNLLLPTYFVGKRVLLIICVFCLPLDLVSVLIALTMFSLVLVIHTQGFAEKSKFRAEIFSETTNLCFLYGLQGLKGQLFEAGKQYNASWSLCVVIGIYLLTHIGVIVITYITSFVRLCKKKVAHRRDKKKKVAQRGAE